MKLETISILNLLNVIFASCCLNLAIGQTTIPKIDLEPFTLSSPKEVGWDKNELQQLVDSIHFWCDNEEIMGAEVLVIKDDKIILHDAYGWSDREENIQLQKNSIYRIKSMTKPLVSTSILMLHQDGIIEDLHDPVSKYLTEMNTPKSKMVTIHQLLTHTSGLSEIFGPSSIRWDNYKNLKSAVKQIGIRGPVHKSGTYKYSDEGAGVAALLVEEISGKNLETFFKDRIFKPLNMNSSFFNPLDHTNRINRINKSYMYDKTSNQFRKGLSSKNSTSYHMKYLVGAFGILSTTLDYAKFMKMVMDAGYLNNGEVLSPSSALLATKRHIVNDRGGYGYFFEINVDKYGSTTNFGHTGISGTAAFAFPQMNTVVLYFTQSMGHANYKRFVNVLRSVDYFESNIELTKWLTSKD